MKKFEYILIKIQYLNKRTFKFLCLWWSSFFLIIKYSMTKLILFYVILNVIMFKFRILFLFKTPYFSENPIILIYERRFHDTRCDLLSRVAVTRSDVYLKHATTVGYNNKATISLSSPYSS